MRKPKLSKVKALIWDNTAGKHVGLESEWKYLIPVSYYDSIAAPGILPCHPK